MKISSASKKVLASALSAAMVVAFAPTVAFAGNGTKVAVSLDANGGIYADGSVTSFPNAEQTDKIALPTVTKGGYAGTWYYDSNADGKIDTSDAAWSNGTSALPEGKTEIAFKAIFANAPVAATAFDASAKTITATINADNAAKLVQDKKYTLKVTGPTGKVLIEKKGVEKGNAVISETATFGTAAGNIDPEFLVGGTYTTTITDEDGNVVYTSGKADSLGITQINVTDTTDTKTDTVLYATAGEDTTILSGATYVDADGYSIDDAGVKALKAGVYDVKKVAASKAVSVSTTAYNATARTIGFTPTYTVPSKGSIETAVVDPSGKTIWSATDSAATAMSATFKQGTSSATFSGATETAGDYVYTATVKDADGDVVATGKAKVTLTQVVYEVGEGAEFKTNVSGTDYTKAENQSFWTSGDAAAAGIDTVAKAKDGYTLATKWQIDGKDVSDNKATAGKVNTFTATAKKTDVSMNVVDPTVDSASYDATKKEWTVKVSTTTAGAQLYWATGKSGAELDSSAKAYDASKGIVTKAETIYVQAKAVTGSTASSIKNNSNVVEMTCLTNAWSDFASTTGAIYKKVGKASTTYAEAADVKAALEAGDAAVKAAGYKTAKDMGELIDSNAKAVYTAFKAYVDATLAAYDNGALVVVGDKAYTMAADTLKAAKKNVANDVKDVKDSFTAAQYKSVIKDVVTHVNSALNAATEDKTVTAADVNAAAAVNAAIAALPAQVTAANATEAKAAAEKVLADFAALSDGAKKLVASTDYAKAAAVADAADEAIETADKATVAKVKGKTVKAKAKKKTTAKLAVVTSETGSTSTFAKTSGNKKITVSKVGKITVKKGLKAGKIYKAKVKATVGAATKTVTVTVKVSK